jgi:hypothetical protein
MQTTGTELTLKPPAQAFQRQQGFGVATRPAPRVNL